MPKKNQKLVFINTTLFPFAIRKCLFRSIYQLYHSHCNTFVLFKIFNVHAPLCKIKQSMYHHDPRNNQIHTHPNAPTIPPTSLHYSTTSPFPDHHPQQ